MNKTLTPPAIADIHNPDDPPRQKRQLRVGTPQVHWFKTRDGVRLRLTRYQGGDKGPVMVVHCIGVSSLMYAIDTIETNLLEYLYKKGFDVWLLDFRFSIELPVSSSQSKFDDVATKDYPAAVAKVREVTNAETIQIVAHGVGSSTFTMAMLAGLQGVRSAVCSQVSTHLFVPLLNRLKTGFYMPSLLSAIGFSTLTAYVDAHANWLNKLYNKSLNFYPIPREERCNSAVCHRITAMYGHLYEHAQLNQETHNVLHEMFGLVNLTAFRQLALISRKGYLVNAQGANVYLPNLERLAIPIAFLHGTDNACVLPKSTEITYQLLSEKNGSQLYSHHNIPQYGHVDCMFGKNAFRDVYPLILQHLES